MRHTDIFIAMPGVEAEDCTKKASTVRKRGYYVIVWRWLVCSVKPLTGRNKDHLFISSVKWDEIFRESEKSSKKMREGECG